VLDAYVAYDPKLVTTETLIRLGAELQVAAATALGVPGTAGALAPEDINVRFESYGLFDMHSKALNILVTVDEYPDRMVNLKKRCQDLRDMLDWLMGEAIPSSLWVRPGTGVYLEI